MINRRILLVFLLMLTIIGFTSCSKDEEAPQAVSLAEVSDDLVAAIRQGDLSLVTDIISDNPERVSDILNTRLPAAGPDPGLTPLMIAARDIDNPELVKLLVSNGADAGLTTEPEGWTALLYALAFNKNDAVSAEVLKADNPNKDQKLAVAYQPTDADLLRSTPLSSEKNTGYVPAGATALILATFISDGTQALSKIKLLTTSGVDLEAGDENGRKAALYAAVHHNAAVLNALLGAGADVKGLQDASGNTVLAHVVEHGADVAVVDALVGAGLPVDEENKEGYTALTWAAQKGGPKSADFISKLLAKGADVNKVNAQQGGRTALIFAVQGGHVGAVKVLIHAEDIDIGQTDDSGKTALAYATDNAEIAALIAEHALPTLTIAPATLSFTATGIAQTVTITLSNADSWAVGTPTYTDGAGWLTATQGTGDDVNVLEVTVSAHTGTTDRSGSVALTPAGGTAVRLSVTQTSPPSLSVSPTSLAFTTTAAGSKTATITLSNADSWAVGTPTYTDGADWLTVTKSENTLTVGVSAHTGDALRRGSVSLTPAAGAAVSLSVIQAGTAPSLSVDPTPLSFTSSETEAKTVVVTLYSADSWAVGTPSDSWLTAEKGTGDAVNTLKVTVSAHTGVERTGSVVLTPAQGSTNGEVVTLSVTQDRAAPSLSVEPASLDFTATGIAQRVTITLTNANSWTGETSYTHGDGWITATPTQGTGVANILIVTVSAHTGAAERTGSVTLTPAQGNTNGDPVSLSVTQTSPPSLTLSTPSLSFTSSATAGQTVTVALVNANSWTGEASYTHGPDWLTVAQGTGDDANTLTVTVDAYTGTTDRRGSVVLTPAQDGTDGTAVRLSVTQTSPPSLSLDHTSLSSLDPPSLTFLSTVDLVKTVTITFSNGADSWDVGDITYRDGNGWITATKSSTDANVLEVTVSKNSNTNLYIGRRGTLELTSAQGGINGLPVILTIIQVSRPVLETYPENLIFTAAASSKKVGFMLYHTSGWYVEGQSGIHWLTATKNDDNTLTVAVTEQPVLGYARYGRIVLRPYQLGTGLQIAVGDPVTLVVKQRAAAPRLTLGSNSLEFTAASGSQTVEVELFRFFDWSVSTSVNWIIARNTDANILSVSVPANIFPDTRTGIVTLTSVNDDGIGASVTLTVEQAGTGN